MPLPIRALGIAFAGVLVLAPTVGARPRGAPLNRSRDIPVAELPPEVREVLQTYLRLLRTSRDLDECADRFVTIAGGGLVNEDGHTLRASVRPYSLEKDFGAVDLYDPSDLITRVNVADTQGHGYGASAIRGRLYRIWIAKKEGVAGLPAPIQVLDPEGHATIREPRIVGIGSL